MGGLIRISGGVLIYLLSALISIVLIVLIVRYVFP